MKLKHNSLPELTLVMIIKSYKYGRNTNAYNLLKDEEKCKTRNYRFQREILCVQVHGLMLLQRNI